MSNKKVAIIMGSDSDIPVMSEALKRLRAFDVEFEMHIISAHRTPAAAEKFASEAKDKGFGAIIAGAGMAAHLAGVLAAYTTLPVIAVPLKSKALDGLDALLAMVQMPAGIPVACVGIDNAANAALLAVQMLAVSDEGLSAKLESFKKDMAEGVLKKDRELQDKIDTLGK